MKDVPITPRRHWYQFSLRTMFVVITLVSIPLAWVGYSLNWIPQREEARRRYQGMVGGKIQAPAGLWLFGETAYDSFEWRGPPESVEQAQRLFPEATLLKPTPGMQSGMGTGVY